MLPVLLAVSLWLQGFFKLQKKKKKNALWGTVKGTREYEANSCFYSLTAVLVSVTSCEVPNQPMFSTFFSLTFLVHSMVLAGEMAPVYFLQFSTPMSDLSPNPRPTLTFQVTRDVTYISQVTKYAW